MSGEGQVDYFHHVRDFRFFELPFGQELHIPPVMGFPVTKFMILQVAAGIICLFIFRGLAVRARSGQPVRGRFWNFWETIALYVRDEVVRPTIGDGHHGHHDDHGHGDTHSHDHHTASLGATGAHYADRFLPFVWTCFFYVLICNLIGAIPTLGAATGSISVTLALAICAFLASIVYSMKEIGVGGFFKNFAGGIKVESAMDFIVVLILVPIEIVGFLIKHGVLAIRLFANIMGGHTVLGVLLILITMAANGPSWAYYIAAPSSAIGQAAISLLELMVAFIQAYVFAFLATIFIASGLHEH
jgi:F-type H+-transporting ATPase subunit a